MRSEFGEITFMLHGTSHSMAINLFEESFSRGQRSAMLIAHISDPHICPRGRRYRDAVDSNAQLALAIGQLNSLLPRPAIVIVTGDVVDEGTGAEYSEARAILGKLSVPYVVIPGNHDDREVFRSFFADHTYLPDSGPINFVIDDRGPVRLVGLDITVPGEHHGLMEKTAACWLDDVLAGEPTRPTMIMMHQPPFASHIPYIDAYWCRKSWRLAEVTKRYPAVTRIVCGHVHRFMVTQFGGTTLCTAPSTATAIALQIRPDAEPCSFAEPPAFLLHHWTEEGGLVTHYVPIGIFPGPFPFA